MSAEISQIHFKKTNNHSDVVNTDSFVHQVKAYNLTTDEIIMKPNAQQQELEKVI